MKQLKKWFACLTLFLIPLLISGEVQIQAASGLEVHFLNVGQGDSTLIRCGDHAMLIDAGGEDDTEPVLNYIMNKQGLSSLDYVIGTHPHEDHIGSLDEVIESVNVSEVMLPEVTANTNTFLEVLTAIEEKELEITIPKPGEVYELGDASVVIIAPNESYGDDLNNWSIGVKVTYGDTSFVFTGDAEIEAEQDIVNAGIDLDADVFHAGHHGSSTSNSNALLNAVSPDYAVISCGTGNSYGHPNAEALERFDEHGIQIFRTDLQGTIVAYSDGSDITWNNSVSTNWTSGDGEVLGGTSSEDTYSEEEKAGESVQDVSTEQTVHITKTGEKYHSAGCQYLSKSDIPISLSDAKNQGYTPCSKCSPPR